MSWSSPVPLRCVQVAAQDGMHTLWVAGTGPLAVVRQHWRAIREFLETGDEDVLAPFAEREINCLAPDEYDGFDVRPCTLAASADDVFDLAFEEGFWPDDESHQPAGPQR